MKYLDKIIIGIYFDRSIVQVMNHNEICQNELKMEMSDAALKLYKIF